MLRAVHNCGVCLIMQLGTVEIDAPDLVERIEKLSQHELDHLPFGVILLDRNGTVQFYSETEARLSGYGKIPMGQNIFELLVCPLRSGPP